MNKIMFLAASERRMILDAMKYTIKQVWQHNSTVTLCESDVDSRIKPFRIDPEDHMSQLEMADILQETVYRMENIDWTSGGVEYCVTQDTFDLPMDIMNCKFYDTFGRLHKLLRRTPTADEFYAACLVTDGELATMLHEHIGEATDFLDDLWCDNEARGANNPDGSFKG